MDQNMQFSDEKAAAIEAGNKTRRVGTGETALMLVVSPNGYKSWRVEYPVGNNRRRSMVLGAFPQMGFEQAKALAEFVRAMAAAGKHTRIIHDTLENLDRPHVAILTRFRPTGRFMILSDEPDERECEPISDLTSLTIDELETLITAARLEADFKKLKEKLAQIQ